MATERRQQGQSPDIERVRTRAYFARLGKAPNHDLDVAAYYEAEKIERQLLEQPAKPPETNQSRQDGQLLSYVTYGFRKTIGGTDIGAKENYGFWAKPEDLDALRKKSIGLTTNAIQSETPLVAPTVPAPGTITPAEQSTGRETQPQIPEIRIGPAIWKNKNHDFPVNITGYAGKDREGRHYVTIDGSATAMPYDEIIYPVENAGQTATKPVITSRPEAKDVEEQGAQTPLDNKEGKNKTRENSDENGTTEAQRIEEIVDRKVAEKVKAIKEVIEAEAAKVIETIKADAEKRIEAVENAAQKDRDEKDARIKALETDLNKFKAEAETREAEEKARKAYDEKLKEKRGLGKKLRIMFKPKKGDTLEARIEQELSKRYRKIALGVLVPALAGVAITYLAGVYLYSNGGIFKNPLASENNFPAYHSPIIPK